MVSIITDQGIHPQIPPDKDISPLTQNTLFVDATYGAPVGVADTPGLPWDTIQAAITADDVSGIGVTGMLPAVVLLDKQGRLLRPAIQQSDGRCGAEVADLLR